VIADSTTTKTTLGRNCGNVMLQILRSQPAPSTSAASPSS